MIDATPSRAQIVTKLFDTPAIPCIMRFKSGADQPAHPTHHLEDKIMIITSIDASLLSSHLVAADITDARNRRTNFDSHLIAADRDLSDASRDLAATTLALLTLYPVLNAAIADAERARARARAVLNGFTAP